MRGIIGILAAGLLAVATSALAQSSLPSADSDPGTPEGRYQLGLSYADGVGHAKDDRIAAGWFRLGSIFPVGLSVPWYTASPRMCGHDNVYRSKAWTELRDDETDPALVYQLSYAYAFGDAYGYPVPLDKTKHGALVRKAAEAGNPFAQSALYYDLIDDEATAQQALTWGDKASAQGVYDMTFRLASVYQDGYHVAVEPAEAVRLYRLAHEQEVTNRDCWQGRFDGGDKAAAFQVGLTYRYGIGAVIDIGKADALFQIAADAGVAEAMNLLAEDWLHNWDSATRNAVDPYAAVPIKERCRHAAGLLRHAADLGNAYAKGALASLIGECVPGTKAEVFALRLEAADGSTRSIEQFQVAYAYEHGEGVNIDLVEASRWYEINAWIGLAGFSDQSADEWRRLQAQLTPTQKAQAHAEAQAYLKTHPFPKVGDAPKIVIP